VISFIVPAHNEEHLLGATLDAINASADTLALSFEVIVVDDASTDATAAIATQQGATVLTVSLRHIAAVRNAGAVASRGAFLIFVDADTLVNATVVRAAIAAMNDGAVGGGAHVIWDGPLARWARALERITTWMIRLGRVAAGCFVFCTREAFDATGGFDERYYATEEIAFSRALKRCGRFVLLRESVRTSGRKLRTHSPAELLRMSAAMGVRGLGGLRDRRNLPLWYGERRHDK
jgi:glycosyltransferase involved in cell wall biosynthesis